MRTSHLAIEVTLSARVNGMVLSVLLDFPSLFSFSKIKDCVNCGFSDFLTHSLIKPKSVDR